MSKRDELAYWLIVATALLFFVVMGVLSRLSR
jgi:hypothetical protein